MRARVSDDFDESRGISEPDDEPNASLERAAFDSGITLREKSSQEAISIVPLDTALSRTIESEIIPRLLMAYRTSESPPAKEVDLAWTDAEIERVATVAIGGTLSDLQAFVGTMRARGLTVDIVIGEVLPAVARHIGWLWETDACTFVDVTFASSRLQQILRQQASALEPGLAKNGEGRRVLLSAMPGEQHTFGLGIVEEFFRRALWDVVPVTPPDNAHLLAAVRGEWFDVVGLSTGADATVGAMPAVIQKVRNASLNRSVRVIVGGNALLRLEDGGAQLGADAIAHDPREALAQMEWMMLSLQQPC